MIVCTMATVFWKHYKWCKKAKALRKLFVQTGWKAIKSQIRCCWKNQLVGYLINFMVMFRRWTSTNIKWIFTFKNNDKKSKWTFLWFKERTICSSAENFLKLCTVYSFLRIKYMHQYWRLSICSNVALISSITTNDGCYRTTYTKGKRISSETIWAKLAHSFAIFTNIYALFSIFSWTVTATISVFDATRNRWVNKLLTVLKPISAIWKL